MCLNVVSSLLCLLFCHAFCFLFVFQCRVRGLWGGGWAYFYPHPHWLDPRNQPYKVRSSLCQHALLSLSSSSHSSLVICMCPKNHTYILSFAVSLISGFWHPVPVGFISHSLDCWISYLMVVYHNKGCGAKCNYSVWQAVHFIKYAVAKSCWEVCLYQNSQFGSNDRCIQWKQGDIK